MRAVALVALAVASLAAPAPGARGQEGARVEVDSNFFSPRELHVDPGDTVTWVAREAGHTVTADDGRFNFFPHRTLERGESVSFTFLAEERVPYYCRVHGARGGKGMAGVIVVGAGGPSPSPSPAPSPVPVEERVVPSEAYPRIADALAGLPPGSVVSLRPGRYAESVVLSVPGTTLRGLGGPAEVVLDGEGKRDTGITVLADSVRVERLTVRGFRRRGVSWEGVRGWRGEELVSVDNGLWGLTAYGSQGGVLRRVVAGGVAGAAIRVAGCRDCDTVVDGAVAEGSHYGVLVANAGGVVLRRSVVRGNGTGVVVRSEAVGGQPPQRGVHVWGNVIEDNDARTPPPEPGAFGISAGVWLAGGWQDVVEGNVIAGHLYGVLVSSMGVPAVGDRVVGNVVWGSRRADLGWDGVGAGTCFSDNRAPGGSEPTSEPPGAQVLYSCSLPVTVGVPSPVVLADLALAAAGAGP